MTEEVLQQFAQIVSDILDKKLKSELQPIRDDIREMKADIERMKADIEWMKADIERMKADIEQMKSAIEKLEHRVTDIELRMENGTDKSIRILAENHIDLSRKLDQAIPAVNKQCVYEIKVDHIAKEVEKIKTNVAGVEEEVAVLKQKMA